MMDFDYEHISLETARKLHEMGIECSYKTGKFVYRRYKHGHRIHLIQDWTEDEPYDDDLPDPQMAEMLKQIEHSQWLYSLIPTYDFNSKQIVYRIAVWRIGADEEHAIVQDTVKTFENASQIEAVAEALYWVKYAGQEVMP